MDGMYVPTPTPSVSSRPVSCADGRLLLKNPGGTVYRENGLVPMIDYRDPPALRMVHLRNILSRAARKAREL